MKSLGLKYVNLPVPREGPYSDELCARVKDTLNELLNTAKPVVVHCRTGRRAETIIKQADPHFLEDHTESKVESNMTKSARTLSSSCVMGLCFGAAMDLGKVTLPLVIREQFLFRRFLMVRRARFTCLVVVILKLLLTVEDVLGRGCQLGAVLDDRI